MTTQPLTKEQVAALLAVAMAYDNRNPGEANLLAWMEAAHRGRWRFGPAREAIHAHYAESTKFVMPGDITQRLRVESRYPPRYGTPPEIEEAPAQHPAGQDRIRQVVERLAEVLRWPRTQSLRDPALSVICPHCHAAVGRPCTRMETRGAHRGEYIPISHPHPSRKDLAEAAA